MENYKYIDLKDYPGLVDEAAFWFSCPEKKRFMIASGGLNTATTRAAFLSSTFTAAFPKKSRSAFLCPRPQAK